MSIQPLNITPSSHSPSTGETKAASTGTSVFKIVKLMATFFFYLVFFPVGIYKGIKWLASSNKTQISPPPARAYKQENTNLSFSTLRQMAGDNPKAIATAVGTLMLPIVYNSLSPVAPTPIIPSNETQIPFLPILGAGAAICLGLYAYKKASNQTPTPPTGTNPLANLSTDPKTNATLIPLTDDEEWEDVRLKDENDGDIVDLQTSTTLMDSAIFIDTTNAGPVSTDNDLSKAGNTVRKIAKTTVDATGKATTIVKEAVQDPENQQTFVNGVKYLFGATVNGATVAVNATVGAAKSRTTKTILNNMAGAVGTGVGYLRNTLGFGTHTYSPTPQNGGGTGIYPPLSTKEELDEFLEDSE